MKRMFLYTFFLLVSSIGFGQTQIQIGSTETFGTSGASNFGIFTRSGPIGWSTSNSPITSSTLLGYSGSNYARLQNATVNSTFLTLSNPISTINRSAITVKFVEWTTGTFTTTSRIKLEYKVSSGGSYSVSGFVSSATNSTNGTLKTFTLPGICENVSTLYLRFAVSSSFTTSGATYRMDDFGVYGTVTPMNYYNDISGGLLDDFNSWWTTPSGTGSQPTAWDEPLQTFHVVNGPSATVSNYWQVSGTGSKIVVGDGINPINFILPNQVDGTIDLTSNATLSLNGDIYPQFGTISGSSTVDYMYDGNQTITQIPYGQLVLSGNGTKYLSADLDLIGSGSTITVASGTIFNTGTYVVKGPGNVIINGTVQTENLNGLSGSSNTTFDSNISTINLSASTIDYSAPSGSQTILPFSGSNSYNNVILSGSADMVFSNAAYDFTGDFSKTGSGTESINSNAIFTFKGAAQNIAGLTYPTVIFSGSGDKTLSGLTTIVSSLTVNGSANVVTSGNLILQSTDATNGAYILDNTPSGGISGAVTVQRIVTPGRPGTNSSNGLPILVSSPVSGNLSLFQPTNSNFFYYVPGNAANSRYVRVSVSNPAVAGQGYLLRRFGGALLSLTGNVNNGNITQNLSFAGDNMNLIGNPYPSSIIWNSSSITMTNLASSNQFKIFDGAAYQVKNIGDVIPMGQGFFVEAASSGASVVFTNASRGSNLAPLYRVQSSSDNRTELWIRKNNKQDMAVLWPQDNADSKTYINRYDGKKLMPSDATYPAVYFPKGGNNLDVFTLGTGETNVSVPVGVKIPKDTTYTLEFKGKENLDPAYNVFLIDSVLNVVQDLKSTQTYTFTATTSTGNRFRILVSQVITDVNDVISSKAEQISIYSYGSFAYINSGSIPTQIVITDLTGNTVFRSAGNGAKSTTVDMQNSPTGIYIATVETEGKVFNKKFILSK